MNAKQIVFGFALLASSSVASRAQAPVLSSIGAPYANLQSTVTLGNRNWGPGSAAYGPVGTPLVLSGSDLGATGAVQFIPYKNGTPDPNVGPITASPTSWTSSKISVPVPAGSYTGVVQVKVEGKTSNALPFIVTPGQYAASCPTEPTQSQLQIVTASLEDGSVGQSYSVTLDARGGTQAYTWSVSGSLPAGLTLNASTGVLSGTPTAPVSQTPLTFEVTDSSSPQQSNQAELDLTIEQTPLSAATVYQYTASYDGNGNVSQSTDTVMGSWQFNYDAFNHVRSGLAVSGGSGSQDFTGQNLCWAYDSYGNRTAQGLPPVGAQCSTQNTAVWVYANNNNQVSGVIAPGATQPSPSPLGYDQAGNVTGDLTTGNSYVYDAEGRVCAVQSPALIPGQPPMMTGYIYDAEGNRIAKGSIASMSCDPTVNGFQIQQNYVLGPSGEELSMLDGGNNWKRTNVYAGGKLMATYDIPSSSPAVPALHFHLEDPLGTRRMQLSAIGQPETDTQSLPFGDELYVFPDVYAPQTADDATPLHFTGKERDSESGNDYFSARYYASSMGRFMSPDPLPWLGWQHPPEGSSEEEEEESHKKFEEFIANPQNFNMYAYVNNNPLNHTDPTGMAGCKAGDKTFTTCTITVTYDPKTSKGTLTVTGMNKGDKEATTLLTASVVVGGDGHVTPTGTFTAKSWEKDHVSTLYGNAANTPWSKTALGGNAFGPYQLHIKELDGRGIMIHGTMGPGWSPTTWGNAIFLSPTSHGCIRMCNADDINLHNMMPNPSGNKIIIQTTP